MMLVLKVTGVILCATFLAAILALVKCISIMLRAEYFKSQGCTDEDALEKAMKEDMQHSYNDTQLLNQSSGAIAF